MRPAECARAVLKGPRNNDRIIIVADYDVDAAINAFRPDHAQGVDEYLSNCCTAERAREDGLFENDILPR